MQEGQGGPEDRPADTPQEQPQAGAGQGGPIVEGQPQGDRPLLADDSTKVWLLSIFTCGIYGAIWYHRLAKELGEWSRGRIETDPTTSVLAITLGGCLIVPPWISWIGTFGRVRQAQQMAGLEPQADTATGILYLFLFGYGYKWLQDQLNELAARQPSG